MEGQVQAEGNLPWLLWWSPACSGKARAKGRRQPIACAQGPIQNLNDHLASPFVNNGFANATKCAPRPFARWPVAQCRSTPAAFLACAAGDTAFLAGLWRAACASFRLGVTLWRRCAGSPRKCVFARAGGCQTWRVM